MAKIINVSTNNGDLGNGAAIQNQPENTTHPAASAMNRDSSGTYPLTLRYVIVNRVIPTEPIVKNPPANRITEITTASIATGR